MEVQKFHYQCVDCSAEYDAHEIRYLCPACEKRNSPNQPPLGVLKAIYNYAEIRLQHGKGLKQHLVSEDYFDLLPIHSRQSFPKLRVGKTPVYNYSELVDEKKCRLFLKDDSQNPTFSFKDRASYMVSAFAKERNITTIAAASTGNAGSSIAGICASQKQNAIVFVPESAPVAKLTQIIMYGAKIVPVQGSYDNAFDLSIEASKQFGWYNRNTAFNPITIEGKKTVAFEIFDQFPEKLPDYIFVPVGDGVIISGLYKGFEDLLNLHLIEKIPVIIAVQAEGSCNVVDNLTTSHFIIHQGTTVADSISVNIPRNFNMTKSYLSQYNGVGIKVSDKEILTASEQLSKQTGIFTEPASAASYAGFQKMFESGVIQIDSTCLLLLTGSGLKDLKAVNQRISGLKSIKCKIDEVKKLLEL